jgi:plastocyanin
MTDTASTRRLPALGAGVGSLLLVLAACSTATSTSSAASPSTAASEAASMAASESAEASADGSMAAGPTVTITGTSSFGTDEVTVPSGQQLTVINDSSFPHTVTEGENGGEAADSRVNEQVAAGETIQVSFPEAGDYNITCLFHAGMNMVVHVE